jgi:phosphatidylserine decarboxylase
MAQTHITNKLSKYFGKFASTPFGTPLQNIINNAYVKLLGLDMSEFRSPSSYKTLNELFTRELIIPRKVDNSISNFISPTDSLITQMGKLQNDTLFQIKGMSYNINELLTSYIDEDNIKKLYNGEYMNFYLSPKDYHRYHAPYFFEVTKLIHVPGNLYPVNLTYLNKEQNLFVKNERVILECKKDDKIFYMVFVGALNVGQMVFEFEPRVQTNTDQRAIKVYEYDNIHINKGELLGYFKMGSTVVMIWQKDMIELYNLLHQKVRFADIIAKVK